MPLKTKLMCLLAPAAAAVIVRTVLQGENARSLRKADFERF